MTDAERLLWSQLRRKNLRVRFRRQVPFERYVLDFYSHEAQLNIELDGGQHYTEPGIERDSHRDNELRSLGLEVLRFSDRDVLTNLEGVLETINIRLLEKLRDKRHC